MQAAVIILSFSFFSISPSACKSESVKFSFDLPSSAQSFKVRSDNFILISDLVFPVLTDDDARRDNWRHTSRVTRFNRLAGVDGECLIDVFDNGFTALTREFWISSNRDKIAVRHRVTNNLNRPIGLKSLIPVRCKGPDRLVFTEEKRVDRWNVLIQERLKNGNPRTIVPCEEQACEIDPFCIFHVDQRNSENILLGYLNQTDHLARMILKFKENNRDLLFESLTAECQFDGVLIPGGGERTSQWLLIMAGHDANELIEEYAERLALCHGIGPPEQNAPAVFCSWYFHGAKYNESYFADDIKALQRKRIPFDVFLIDDCWASGNWGNWTPGNAFPSGMKYVADTIKNNGYRPGIWTAPFSVDMDSDLAREHPEWLLKTVDGSRVVFGYAVKAWILDPTYPGVSEHLEDLYRRLSRDYGFCYFKLDFMRSVFVFDSVKFYDPYKTRLEAYRTGLEAIRTGAGPEAYISVCGGHFGGSLGLAQSQRSGSDVVSIWRPEQIRCFRQNILRTWMNKLWHVDPDALMIRRRSTPFHDPNDRHAKLSLGLLTDEEAVTFAVNQYIGGNLVCFSEYMKELDSDRRLLYRHIIPSINKSSIPLDLFHTPCPSLMLTEVDPLCESLPSWNTIAVINWEEETKDIQIPLQGRIVESIPSSEYIVFEFVTGEVFGVFSRGQVVRVKNLMPHHSRVLRIAPWDGENPVLAGTDLHFSGGAVEISEWHVQDHRITGKVETGWDCPVTLYTAFPADNESGCIIKITKLGPGQCSFYVEN